MIVEVRKITDIDDIMLNIITDWMYNWWGVEDGYSYDAVKERIRYSCNEERLPQTYGLYLDDKLIGMYQFTLEDVFVRPDLYPWLACVYIDEAYRGSGYGRVLMESVYENAKINLNTKELYLYTKHIGLYEKYGWKYVSDVETFKIKDSLQRLYKLEISSY